MNKLITALILLLYPAVFAIGYGFHRETALYSHNLLLLNQQGAIAQLNAQDNKTIQRQNSLIEELIRDKQRQNIQLDWSVAEIAKLNQEIEFWKKVVEDQAGGKYQITVEPIPEGKSTAYWLEQLKGTTTN